MPPLAESWLSRSFDFEGWAIVLWAAFLLVVGIGIGLDIADRRQGRPFVGYSGIAGASAAFVGLAAVVVAIIATSIANLF